MNPTYKFEINRPTVNLLNPKTIVSGMLNTTNGNISSSTVYQTSDFIPVTPGTNYKLCDAETFTSLVASAACFYTANKTFISGQYGIGETPANAAYLRVSYQGLSDGYGVFPDGVSSYSDYVTPIAYPVYNNDLAKDFEKESNQEFFRAKLSGKLTFQSLDYDFIVAQPFDFQFVLEIFISYNAGQSWTSYWRGTFWKTDCEFDNDAKTVVVQPTVLDQYNDVLAGMDKEYNLIELAPEIVPVKADKRPMIQVYVPGQSVIGCFLSNMWWEQECEPVEETELVTIDGNDYQALEYKYHFAKNATGRIVDVSGATSPELPGAFVLRNPPESVYFSIDNGTYTFWAYRNEDDPNNTFDEWYITRNSDNVDLWYGRKATSDPSVIPYDVILHPVDGTGATGDVAIYVHDLNIYARYVLDVMDFRGQNTYSLPTDDLVENNRNYHRAIGYSVSDVIYFSARLTSTPTQWGIYQPGQYYQQPYLYGRPELFPVSRNAWGAVSIWFTSSATDRLFEESGRAPYTLKDAYPLASVISVLLAKIAPNITHDATTDYSQFLYGTNLIGITQTLLITPKSNLVTAGYDQPAQKAPITLKNVLDMLRDCFRCYWFIDEQNRFRVEHIQYFRNGGSYSGTPVVGIDLTTQRVPRNGKVWSFAKDQFNFDKPAMAARYQFGWMDDVTQLFDGFPIDIVSKYVNPENIEQINVSRFTSDVDYILLNPGAVSKDGFALLSAKYGKQLQLQWVGASQELQCYYNSSGSLVQVTTIPWTLFGAAKVDVSEFVNNNISINVVCGGVAYCSFVDENNSVLESWTQTTQQVKSIPEDAKYLLLSNRFDNVPNPVAMVDVFILPYVNFQYSGTYHILQNAYAAFCFLQRYYDFDMPAPIYEINGEQMFAQGIKKLKKQTLRFPVLNDPYLYQLVKTNLGDGTIEKLSVNLSSRNATATLKYDTE